MHELLDIMIDWNGKIFVWGFGCYGENFLFFVNLNLNTDESTPGMFCVHVKFENGPVLLISWSHDKEAPHFEQFLHSLFVQVILVL